MLAKTATDLVDVLRASTSRGGGAAGATHEFKA
jgi:hypothetical protein